jgi:hypothetical protein
MKGFGIGIFSSSVPVRMLTCVPGNGPGYLRGDVSNNVFIVAWKTEVVNPSNKSFQGDELN